MNIFIGNLSTNIYEQDLRALFTQYGIVTNVKIMVDPKSRRSQGFGFVEMSERSQAEKAINKLNNFDHMGSILEVKEARPGSSSRPDQHFSYRNGEPSPTPGGKKKK